MQAGPFSYCGHERISPSFKQFRAGATIGDVLLLRFPTVKNCAGGRGCQEEEVWRDSWHRGERSNCSAGLRML